MLGVWHFTLWSIRGNTVSFLHVGCSRLVHTSGVPCCSLSISSCYTAGLLLETRLVSSRHVRRFSARTRSRSMTLDSGTFDDSRLDSFDDSRLGLVRWISTRLAPEGRVILSWLAPGMGVNTVWCMGLFTLELFRRQDLSLFGADCLETHLVNNKILTHWGPFLSCHRILFRLFQIDLSETRF